MSYIAAEDILEAKKTDLLTFLRNYAYVFLYTPCKPEKSAV